MTEDEKICDNHSIKDRVRKTYGPDYERARERVARIFEGERATFADRILILTTLDCLHAESGDGGIVVLDHDGEQWHIGDEFKMTADGFVHKVSSIMVWEDNATIAWRDRHGCGSATASMVRHYKRPTVEDTLCQLLGECEHAQMLGYKGVPRDILDSYARKLRLVGEDE